MICRFRAFKISVVTALLLAMPQAASAHFLWIVAGSRTADGKVHVYFAESATPDNPDLLDRVANLKVWHVQGKERIEIPVAKGADSLVAEPGKISSTAWGASLSYGVIERGGEKFLLKYHAKSLTSGDPKDWAQVAGPEALPLEIVPRVEGETAVIRVLWQGKPANGDEIAVSYDGGDGIQGATNDAGEYSFRLPVGKLASIRARHVESVQGKQSGKEFESVRHYATLTIALGSRSQTDQTSRTAATISESVKSPLKDNNDAGLPMLQPTVTSFGGAIIGNELFVCGGHLGGAHDYSAEEQSDQLRKLNLAHPDRWEVVGTVPKRTGFPLIAHGGKLYRIGGFEAHNQKGEEQNLVSTHDFARYDVQTNQWNDLAPMPLGRSSHDAVVIGDRLYVFGGWELNGPGKHTWHETGLVADLTENPIAWEEISVPFRRRAVSLGEWRGKVVVIGGMQEKGGITLASSVFDPSSEQWSDGPALVGEKMDGFGSSAFLCAGKLYVSTYSGKLQQLSEDGSRWEVVGQMAHPRFFHRMLPADDGRLLIVGGASMDSGKIALLEWIKPN